MIKGRTMKTYVVVIAEEGALLEWIVESFNEAWRAEIKAADLRVAYPHNLYYVREVDEQ